ncbi:MAG TPA: DNA polymerase III subunit delta [Pirellulales bacterium]|jgi:DNA polymerase-3 subunit delta
MAKPLEALDYLANPGKYPATGFCVLFGDEPFLKRQVMAALKGQVLSGADADFSISTFNGPESDMRDVTDALATRALFGGGRHLVLIDEADEFVSNNRPALEHYVGHQRSSALLVLDVKTWPSTTRLYKALAENGLQIECKFPSPARLLKWLFARARESYGVEIEPVAAELLVERTETELGLIDQELAKLAAMAGQGGRITRELVNEAVGGWRVQTAWEMLDAALAGQPRQALVQLDRLLLAGEVPIALLAQIAASLRRFAAAARVVDQAERSRRPINLRRALEEAGVKPFVLSKAEQQLRHLGRARAEQLYRWLLEADLALKGTSSSPARSRLVLEELMVRLAAPANAVTSTATPALAKSSS